MSPSRQSAATGATQRSLPEVPNAAATGDPGISATRKSVSLVIKSRRIGRSAQSDSDSYDPTSPITIVMASMLVAARGPTYRTSDTVAEVSVLFPHAAGGNSR